MTIKLTYKFALNPHNLCDMMHQNTPHFTPYRSNERSLFDSEWRRLPFSNQNESSEGTDKTSIVLTLSKILLSTVVLAI
jgi:hypothetical protein